MKSRKTNMLSMNNDASQSSKFAKRRLTRRGSFASKTLSVVLSAILVVGMSPASKMSWASSSDATESVSDSAASIAETENAAADASAAGTTTDSTAANGSATDAASSAASGAEAGSTSKAASNLTVETEGGSEAGLASADDDASLSSATSQLSSGTYWNNGDVTFTTIDENNTFSSSAWDVYRDKAYDGTASALGLAGSFHLVAFDTLNTANSHSYGNMLAKNMTGSQDFGTDDRFEDLYGHSTLTYIQNYQGTHSRFGATSNNNQAVVFGSNTDTFSLFAMNENGHDIITYGNTKTSATKVEFPKTIAQDLDSSTTPFINLNDVKAQSTELSNTLAARSDWGGATYDFSDMNNKQITYTKGSGCAYVEVSLSDLTGNGNPIRINDVPTDGSGALVINVDCSGSSATMPDQIILNAKDGRQAGVGEVDADTGYVLWNFYNASGATITGTSMVSSVLAPGATLNLKGNACGTFIADNITIYGETHTRPFHGKLSTSVEVSKEWLDANGEVETDVDHSPVMAELYYADESGQATRPVTDASGNAMKVELSASNNWSYKWTNLSLRDENGNFIKYTVKESNVQSGYEFAGLAGGKQADGSFAYTLKNKRVEAESVSVSATKVWKDNGNIDNARPDSITVNVKRKVDGGQYAQVDGATMTLSAANGWMDTVTGLPAADASGKAYTYTVDEGQVEGYEGTVTPGAATLDESGNKVYPFTLTNTRASSQIGLKITKAWNDKDDQDGVRPSFVTVKLMRSVNGGASDLVRSVTLSEKNNWTYEAKDLPRKSSNDTYSYFVDEVSVAGYECTIVPTQDADGNYTFALTNTHEAAKTSASVRKVWDDSDDADGLRPGSVTVRLCADGEPVAGKTAVLSDANKWQFAWDDLDKCAGGEEIAYTVEEVGAPDGYAPKVTGGKQADGAFSFTLTNTHEAERTSVSVEKKWVGADGSADDADHGAVTVQLCRQVAGGAVEPVAGMTVTLSKDNGWRGGWADLPAKQGGKAIAYSVAEADVPEGYTASVTTGQGANSFVITNTADKKTQVSVSKVWSDSDDADGLRPDSVTVQLCTKDAEGVSRPIAGKTAVLSDANGWSFAWDKLDVKDADGKEIDYAVQEANVPAGYAVDLSGGKQADGSFSFTMTNSHSRSLTQVKVTKVWDDAQNIDGLRADSVKAQLYVIDADGNANPVAGVTAIDLSEENDWTYTWTNLPAKDAGKAIKYTVREVEVPDGYDVSIQGASAEDGSFSFTMTNTHEAEEVEFSLSGYSVRSITEPVPDAEKVCYVDPKVNKALVGRALTDGEFSFQLIDDATGQVVSTASNDKLGMVDFDKANNVTGDDMNPCCLQFTAPGTYTYTVRENSNATQDPTIEYSKQVVTFVTKIAEVTDADGAKSLKEEWSRYECYDSAADRAAGAAPSKVIAVEGASNEHPTITNSVKAIQLGLTKFSADSSAELKGAVYGLYRAGSIAADGSTDAVLVAKATSGDNGHMTFSTTDASEVISTDTEYWFQEISAPEGYKLSSEQTQKFQIKRVGEGGASKYQLAYADGTTSKEYSIGTVIEFGDGSGVTDEVLTVKVNKVDSARQGLAGAKLGVRLADSTEVIEEWTSNGAGHVLSGLVAGKEYVLYESEVPDGFTKAADVTFTVDETGAITLVDAAFAKVNDKDVLNAYATAGDLSLVDYKNSEIVNEKVVQREQPKTTATSTSSSNKASAVKTGDSIPVIPIVAVVVVCLAVAVVAGVMSRRKKG